MRSSRSNVVTPLVCTSTIFTSFLSKEAMKHIKLNYEPADVNKYVYMNVYMFVYTLHTTQMLTSIPINVWRILPELDDFFCIVHM